MNKICVLLLAALSVVPGTRAQDVSTEQIIVRLSRPGQPGKLAIKHEKGSISVLGYDGQEVVVTARLRGQPPADDSSAPRLKRIPIGEIGLAAEEFNNTVTVTTNSKDKTLDLDVRVPRDFSLNLSTVHNGRIEVRNVNGEFDITNTNGEILLDGVSGSALLNTFDGSITARFLEVTPGVPMAFSTVYGKIDVSLPPDVRLVAKMKTTNGRVYSDFDMRLEQRKVRRDALPSGVNRLELEEWTYARINGGGPEILFTSFDGNIYLRKVR